MSEDRESITRVNHKVLWPAPGTTFSTIEAVYGHLLALAWRVGQPGWPEALRCLVDPLIEIARDLQDACDMFNNLRTSSPHDRPRDGHFTCRFEAAVQRLLAHAPWLITVVPHFTARLQDEARARDAAVAALVSGRATVSDDGAVVMT